MVWRNWLWYKMWEVGIGGINSRMWRAVESLNVGSGSCIFVAGEEVFLINQGVLMVVLCCQHYFQFI